MRPAAAEHRQLHVLGRVQRADQVVELKDEADGLGAVGVRVGQRLEPLAADGDAALVRPVERADQVEERALAATGGTGEGDELAGLDAE